MSKPTVLVKGKKFEMFTNPFNSRKHNLWKKFYHVDSEGVVKPNDTSKDVFNLKAME